MPLLPSFESSSDVHEVLRFFGPSQQSRSFVWLICLLGVTWLLFNALGIV